MARDRVSVRRQRQCEYKLQSREKGEQNRITFAEGTGTSFSGEPGLFDPTIRRNGIHDIRLFAEDAAGNPSVIVQPVILEGSLKANYANPVSDDGVGLPDGLSIPRQYDSRMQGSGDFGPGRTLPSSDVSVASTAILGEGWTQIMIPEYFGLIPRYYVTETRRHIVVIRLSDTEIIRFDMKTSPESDNAPLRYLEVVFKAAPGSEGNSLEAIGFDKDVVMTENMLKEFGDRLYNPREFRLTRPDGTVYVIHAQIPGTPYLTLPSDTTFFV